MLYVDEMMNTENLLRAKLFVNTNVFAGITLLQRMERCNFTE